MNMQDQDFLNRHYSDANDVVRTMVVSHYNVWQEMIAEAGDVNQAINNKAFIYEWINACAKRLSKTTFFRLKTFLKNIYADYSAKYDVKPETLRFITELSIADVVSESEILQYFFADLDSVLQYITYIGTCVGLNQETDLLNLKAYVVLLWYKFSTQQILELLKSDLNIQECKVKETAVAPEHFGIISDYAQYDVYRGFSLRNYTLQSSKYLFRGEHRETLTVSRLAQVVMMFNQVAEEYGEKLISVKAIQRNALYVRLYSRPDVPEHALKHLIKEDMGCDDAHANEYRRQYLMWRKVFG